MKYNKSVKKKEIHSGNSNLIGGKDHDEAATQNFNKFNYFNGCTGFDGLRHQFQHLNDYQPGS